MVGNFPKKSKYWIYRLFETEKINRKNIQKNRPAVRDIFPLANFWLNMIPFDEKVGNIND